MRPIVRPFFLGIISLIGIACESYFEPDERERAAMEVVSVYPPMYATDFPLDEPIRVKLNKHVDLNYFSSSDIDLRSGGYTKWTMAYYDPLTMELVIWTSSAMLPNAAWDLNFTAGFRALDGSYILPQHVTRFETGTQENDAKPYSDRTYLSDVKPVFDTHCVRCHGDAFYTDLDLRTPQAIARTALNVPSSQWPTLERVSPDRPGASYLVYKLLDANNVSGRVMPRTLDDNETAVPLTYEEKRIIVDWVLSGNGF